MPATSQPKFRFRAMRGITALLLCGVAACAVGPDYKRPVAVNTPAYKENLDWKQATPKDNAIRGNWWEIFGDADLNTLEGQVNISNETIKAAEAQFRQARALVAEARAGYFPTASATASLTRSKIGSGTHVSTFSPGINNEYNASLGASWEPDFWGSIRRSVESGKAAAQASAADVQSARLSAQTELANDYLSLRVTDEQKRLLADTVEAYKRSLQITQNLYKSGVDSQGDVMQARVQLESTQAQLINTDVQRTQFEHAIAILIGKAPADFALPPVASVPAVPVIPVGVPSEILERRPDIAGNERRVAAANAQIGVTEAAFFPNFTLAASGGFDSASLAHWLSIPNRVWSIGPSVVESIFDAGLRSAQTEAAIAAYDQTVATYRQTVLGAFQEVEDNLAALRILEQEMAVQQKAVEDAHTSTTIALNQYKAGTVSYVTVITAQTAELSNKLTAINIEKQQLSAAATLIAALGGGWDAKELDKPAVTEPKTTPFSILPATITPESTPLPSSSSAPAIAAPTPTEPGKP